MLHINFEKTDWFIIKDSDSPDCLSFLGLLCRMKGEWTEKIKRKRSFLSNLLSNNPIKTNALQAFPFWAASFLTGLIAVVYTKLFGYAEGLFQKALGWHWWIIFIVT